MFETDDIEDDYFTPLGSTTLANIFENSSNKSEGDKSVSLKYSPHKPQDLALKLEDPLSSQCLFACVFLGFQWTKNIYIVKGKIGFAILKNVKNNSESHKIILYDSNKHTLSSATISPKLEVTVKGKLYISYYDDFNKYWSVYATEEEINKVVELLNGLNATVNYSASIDQRPPEPYKNNDGERVIQSEKVNTESDTDSYVNKKTKASILSRMAIMGQSVLPVHALSAGRSSDSSDTNEHSNSIHKMRYKPCKTTFKKGSSNIVKSSHDTQTVETCNTLAISPKPEGPSVSPIYALVNGNLVPVTNTNKNSIITINGERDYADFNLYLSEQRMSNNELRLSLNKTSDKVDQMLGSIKDLKQADRSSFERGILQKLLLEYETKIKMYERIIVSKKVDCDLTPQISVSSQPNDDHYKSEFESWKIKAIELEQSLREKNNIINELSEEIEQKITQISELKTKENFMIRRTKELEDELCARKEDMRNQHKEDKYNSNEFENKIKFIMNETFQSIAANFEAEENYSGDTIKTTVASIIKKVTIQSLK